MARDSTRRFADGRSKFDIRAEIRTRGRRLFAGECVYLHYRGGSQRVDLERVPRPNFGGQRTYFCCPRCSRRVDILYVDRQHVACRQCLRLSYWSEAITPVQRRVRRLIRMRERLGQSPGASLVGPLPAKPKWMRWPTYERLVAEIEALEHEHWHAPVSARLQREIDKLRASEAG